MIGIIAFGAFFKHVTHLFNIFFTVVGPFRIQNRCLNVDKTDNGAACNSLSCSSITSNSVNLCFDARRIGCFSSDEMSEFASLPLILIIRLLFKNG